MNCVYFACQHCNSYIDAGYRWAYWHLEKPGIVSRSEKVAKEDLVGATDYWEIDDSSQSAWLRDDVLPKIRAFMHEHKDHEVIYVDEEWIYEREESGEKWTEVETGSRSNEPILVGTNAPEITPAEQGGADQPTAAADLKSE